MVPSAESYQLLFSFLTVLRIWTSQMENKTIRGCGYWEHEGIIPSISSANTESQKATGKAAISGCDCPPLSYCLWFGLSNYGTILMSKKKT